jgi:cytochrome c peroxidase
MGKKVAVLLSIVFLVSVIGVSASALTSKEQLGKLIFFDQSLSLNYDQSCAVCHAPESGWTGPISNINEHGAVYEGSIPGAFGNRKPPSAAYATQSPILHYVIEKKEALFIGGNFWDGRATGETLGSPAAEQAKGPFLNPKEQALPNAAELVARVCGASYGTLFTEVWGAGACDNVAVAYNYIGLSIAAYEASPEVNAFTSKYDYALKGKAVLTKQERVGFGLFQGKGKCRLCHVSSGKNPLFTDYTFDNLGVPKNPENPVYDYNPNFTDLGLGDYLASRDDYKVFADENKGKQKVPTLRNVAKGSCEAEPGNPSCIVKAYGHNGYFKSLAEIVHFYNTRDVGSWDPPEVSDNINTTELGNLGLTPEEEAAIVAFLTTLSDGYLP